MARVSPRRAAYNARVAERRRRDRLGIQAIKDEAAAAEEVKVEEEKVKKPAAKKAAAKKPASKAKKD